MATLSELRRQFNQEVPQPQAIEVAYALAVTEGELGRHAEALEWTHIILRRLRAQPDHTWTRTRPVIAGVSLPRYITPDHIRTLLQPHARSRSW